MLKNNSHPKLHLIWVWDTLPWLGICQRVVPSATGNTFCSPRRARCSKPALQAPWGSMKLIHWSLSEVQGLRARLHLLCSCVPTPGHSLGSAKVSRAQTFPSYPSEQGEEHQQSLSLASSYAFSYGSGLVQ